MAAKPGVLLRDGAFYTAANPLGDPSGLGSTTSGAAYLKALCAEYQTPGNVDLGMQAASVSLVNLSDQVAYVQIGPAGQQLGPDTCDVPLPPGESFAGPAGGIEYLGVVFGGASTSQTPYLLVVASLTPLDYAAYRDVAPIQSAPAGVLAHHDSHSGVYGYAAEDVAVTLDQQSREVTVWNRGTAALWVNWDEATSAGGTDMMLLPGEWWGATVAANAVHYRGGASTDAKVLELQVWS